MSNEYTPTTEQIRNVYAYVHEFDAWLAAHDREVAADAWDEGAHDAEEQLHPKNPYRKGADHVG